MYTQVQPLGESLRIMWPSYGLKLASPVILNGKVVRHFLYREEDMPANTYVTDLRACNALYCTTEIVDSYYHNSQSKNIRPI